MHIWIIVIILFISVILNIILLLKLNIYKKKQIILKDENLYLRNKLSMIEYTYRKFKEGQNPFTTLRDFSNIIKDIYK